MGWYSLVTRLILWGLRLNKVRVLGAWVRMLSVIVGSTPTNPLQTINLTGGNYGIYGNIRRPI
jgi:hypothetical protein